MTARFSLVRTSDYAEAMMARSMPVALSDFDELDLTPGRIAA